MADKYQAICVKAFKKGNKLVARQLLSHISQPATVTTMFPFRGIGPFTKVSLLHLAAHWGWIDVVTELVSVHGCSIDFKDDFQHFPLHYAVSNGHLEVTKYFLERMDSLHVPLLGNLVGEKPLHHACRNGQFNIIQYLINEAHCDPSCVTSDGWTPLHFASRYGHVNNIQYLINKAHCDPSCVTSDRRTPLHIACIYNQTNTVQYLLSTGRVNPLAKDKYGHTAMQYTYTYSFEIITLFEPFVECSTAYPVHTFTKLILTGDSGAGKTSLTELIVRLAARSSTAIECVADVQCFTAGIVPHHIQSELGNFVVYDFAGQQEYYSSHAAVLEHVMQKSAVMFLCLVDLSKSNESICQSLHYWLSFINNACCSVAIRSHVAIIGSHSDLIESASDKEKEKSSLIQAMAARRIKQQEFAGYLSMDCRQLGDTDASRGLVSMLTNSQSAINTSQPVISYYCHVLYAFLRTKLDVVGCSLQYLTSAITKENDSSLPNDQSVLSELLTTLSDKGLILFLNHSPRSSWIVVKTESLLNEINGVLFAPRHFKEHRVLASNTGIVPVSTLREVFPNYDQEMLVGFLESLDFCRPVDPSVLEYTNLQTTAPGSQSAGGTADLLFFPGLVESERPDDLIQQQATLEFGWCLCCVDEHQFLSSRFLHMLVLSVAYKFPLASRYSPSSCVSGLQRRCTIWRNGISWRDDYDITTVIELLDNNRQVLVAMSCNARRPVECGKLRSSLIGLIRHLQQVHCPSVEVREYLISPDLVRQYPLNDLPDTSLFDMYDVARSILCRKPIVLSYKDGRGSLETSSLPLEPYHLIAELGPRYVCQLFNPNMADQPVPETLLREIRKQMRKLFDISTPPFCKELRVLMDRLSIFGGKNPLVSCSVAV